MRLGLGEGACVHIVVRTELGCLLPQRFVETRLRIGDVTRATVHIGHDRLKHMGGVVVTLVHVAAEQGKEALDRHATRRAVHSRCVVDIDCLVAVFVDGRFQLLHDDVDGLVPADSLELALAALAHSLHGVHQAVGAVQPASHGAAPQAGAGLQVRTPEVVGFHVLDFAVFGVPLEDAVSTAVHVALRPVDFVSSFCMSYWRGALEKRTTRSTTGNRQCAQRSTRLNERAAVHAWHSLHRFPLRVLPLRSFHTRLQTARGRALKIPQRTAHNHAPRFKPQRAPALLETRF